MVSTFSKASNYIRLMGFTLGFLSLSGCFEFSEGIRRYEGMEHKAALKYLTPSFKKFKRQMYSFSIRGSKDWCKLTDLELSNKVLEEAAKNPKVKQYYKGLEAYVGSNYALSFSIDDTKEEKAKQAKYLKAACDGIDVAYKQINVDVRACHKSLVLDPHNKNLNFPSGFHTVRVFENQITDQDGPDAPIKGCAKFH